MIKDVYRTQQNIWNINHQFDADAMDNNKDEKSE